ncbi:sensor domain-containing protein [Coxiella burnetii]|uniref:sensor domain-containing protein n=1 Tax=Coxiella burnetii TaxID=777 RepID=UPI000163A1C3|nr:EAL domain-containing protein [Coxiella burnetii]ATN86739.1 diguanylate phosphodiesterase [Coxiella burnetii str. Schperling]EDR36637.1 diguanylate cyclase (GGDEF) domain/cyclic diguanylate phosphodiesterase (EAL) domain protein [Coxiella burnetii Q321]
MKSISESYFDQVFNTLGKLDVALSALNEAIVWTDHEGHIAWCNLPFSQLISRPRIEIIGLFIDKTITLKKGNQIISLFKVCHEKLHFKEEIIEFAKDSKTLYLSAFSQQIVDKKGGLHFIIALQDVTLQQSIFHTLLKNEARIAYLASRDQLTSLPNRREFIHRLNEEIGKPKSVDSKLSLLFLDLDNFKDINDALGHHMGDRVLVHVSDRLRKLDLSPLNYFLGHLGGDEFVILLKDLQQDKDATLCAKKISNAFSESFKIKNFLLYVNFSIGITIDFYSKTDSETLLKKADMAMYQAKKKGRNTFSFYTEKLGERYRHRLILENAFHQALEENQFYLVYQPQYELSTQKIRGMETLLRWKHPELGEISPEDFIPIAEKAGIIIPIGEWVLRHACQQYKQWQSKIPVGEIKLSINVSPPQLIRKKFANSVAHILKETNTPPNVIELEITENSLMTKLNSAKKVLEELREIGLNIAIDDFGTGHSSLAYLKILPIDTVKIDKAFVRGLPDDQHDTAIVKFVIDLARSLNLTKIVEGVEKKEQMEFLLKLGGPLVQGNYFSKAIEADLMFKLLKNQSP